MSIRMSFPALAQNMRSSTVQNILGQAVNAGRKVSNSISSTSFSFSPSNTLTSESGNFILSVLFYIFLFSFIIFIITLLIHFTIYPIYRFSPGAKGIIPISALSEDKVYWTSGQPPPESKAPLDSDSLSSYPFENNFSFSIDIYCTKITSTDVKNRLILYKTYNYGIESSNLSSKINLENLDQICASRASQSSQSSQSQNSSGFNIQDPLNSPSNTDIESYMKVRSSMIMYLTETNDLIVTFFVGPEGTPYSCRPIRNIPLFTPFRITGVVDKRIFTIYLNGKQTFQKIVPSGITFNTLNGLQTSNHRFYSPPSWTDNPTKTIFIQNLHLWPYSISYPEVQKAMPALASFKDIESSSDKNNAS